MSGQEQCFIIMPITTPKGIEPEYRDGSEHFKHVLECLFIPAVQEAGYEARPPIATGADIIHAGIIENLEKSAIVLCDMSCLVPNVFFEFGIRTALNKPVCVVKDELITEVPFDTGIINYHEYKSALDPWFLDQERKALAKHIIDSARRSDGKNTLWKYFGLKSEAEAYRAGPGADDKLDYIAMQIESLRAEVKQGDHLARRRAALDRTGKIENSVKYFAEEWIKRRVPGTPFALYVDRTAADTYHLSYSGALTDEDLADLARELRLQLGLQSHVERIDPRRLADHE